MLKTLKLTNAEINHILTLIEVNERDEWYYGNKKHYQKRTDKLKKKLQKIK